MFSSITYGTRLRSAQAAGFRIVETLHLPGVVLPRHAHEDASINIVITGSLAEGVGHLVGRRDYSCSPQSVLVKPAGEYHENRYGTRGARCIVVQAPSNADRAREATVLMSPQFVERGEAGQIGMRLFRELRLQDSSSQLAIEGLVLMLLASLRRTSGTQGTAANPPVWVTRARDYLQEHFRDRISLTDLASSVGADPSQMSRSFSAAYGELPSEYVRRLRIEWAARQLAEHPGVSIVEVALQAGFADQSHFTRLFRKYCGITPAKFRSHL